MNNYVNLSEVVKLLESGEWELGYGSGSRDDGRYWIQRGGLTKGGESRGVRVSTMDALERRGLIQVVPKLPKQPFWLRRYQLKPGPKGKGKR